MASTTRTRPSSPAPARWLAARRGDLLVQQIKSGIGYSHATKDALETYKLGKIGRCSFVSSSVDADLDGLASIQHLIAVHPLTCTAVDRLDWPRDDVAVHAVTYEIAGHQAKRLNVDGDGFLASEENDCGVTVFWSTFLSVATVLDVLHPELPPITDEHVATVFDQSRQLHWELPARDTVRDLREHDRNYPLVRLDLGDLSIVWRKPNYPRHVDEFIGTGEIAVRSAAFDRTQLARLIELTATPEVGRRSGELLAEIDFLALDSGRDPA